MAQQPMHTVRPRVISLDEAAFNTDEFRYTTEFDQPTDATPEDFAFWNDGMTRWQDKITTGLKAIDAHFAELQNRKVTFASDNAQPSEFATPQGWITLCPHKLINYEECGTLRLLFSTEDTYDQPQDFYNKYCTSEFRALELKMTRDQMHAELHRAEEHRLAKIRGNQGAVDDGDTDDDAKLATTGTALAGNAHETFPIEEKRYHIIPLDIQLRAFNNKTPVPLGIQFDTNRPNQSTRRKWFPENGQTSSRDSLVGAYGHYIPANANIFVSGGSSSSSGSGARPEVLYRADHDHLTSEDFRHWGAYPTEEIERELIRYEQVDGFYYTIPAPNTNAQFFPDVLQYMVLRHYPYLYNRAKTDNPQPYRNLTPQTWYNEANSTINVPKFAMQDFVRLIRRTQNLGLNMMCCDDVRLTCTPLNRSGWSVLPRMYDNFDSAAYTHMPAYHPAKNIGITAELQIRYIPMHKPPKTTF